MTEVTVTRDAVQRRVTEALIEFGAEEESIKPEASWDQLDVDSLDLVELAQIVEDEYGVELRETDMERMETVDDAVTMVTDRLA